jgi:hypothetical protein
MTRPARLLDLTGCPSLRDQRDLLFTSHPVNVPEVL